ncbi:MAG: carbohydrate kinase family protein [Ardenticatenaceae bacterium]|nr:carbohydrate kinase family protein [Anaerolineales bacterium]MCB8979905.1 carbohydrate kinase family protein [Ardenticatenaceae bacterium]
MKIVVTGSIAYDYLMSFPGKFTDSLVADQLHTVSLSFLVDSLNRQRGGTAPNIAYTLALLGGHPRVMATAGQDFGEYRVWLESHGVDTSAIIEIENDFCASFFVNTDQAQNQIASFYTGAMAHAARLSFAQHAADTDLAIISPNAPDAMGQYAAECRALGIPFIYDPSQQAARFTGEELLHGLDGAYMLTVNEYEHKLIQDKTGLNEEQILQHVGSLLVTLAGEGARLVIEGHEIRIPVVPPYTITDPTGAGDAFRAGMMRGMQLGLPWEIAGRMGALAATYVLEQLGPQNHFYSPKEFVARYRQHFDDDGALDVLLAD